MTREGGKLFFTDEEKEKLVVKKYSESELRDKEKAFRGKRKKRRILFLIILSVFIVLSLALESIKYLFYICIGFMCFLIVLYEYVDRINIKASMRKYYIEILAKEKLNVETYIEQTLTPGSDLLSFYPIVGMESTTGYVGKFYIDREQYETLAIGDNVKISVKGDKLW